MSGTYPPVKTQSGPTIFPVCVVQGYNGAPGGGTVIGIAYQGMANPYKACTVYMASFALYATNSVAAVISVQPNGQTVAGNGLFPSGSQALSVSVPASGGPVFYTQAQNIAMTAAGYIGFGLTVTSGNTSINVAFDGIIWASQSGQ